MPPKKKGQEKDEETAMTVHEKSGSLGQTLDQTLTKEQKELVKRTVAKGATDDEFMMFLHYCEKAGVDPLRRQAHFIKVDKTPVMMIGIDGFQARATADPRYRGMVANVVYENDQFEMNPVDGKIAHSFKATKRGKLVGAYAILKREGMEDAVIYIRAEEYERPTKIWREKPEVMLTKTARATLLRREYPDNFSGIYAPEEFGSEITDKGQYIDHSKKAPEPFPTDHVPKKVEPQPEPEIQEAEFRDVEPEAEEPEEEEEDEGEKLPDIPEDVVDDDMTPRDALKAIMDYGWKNEVGHIVRPVIEKHYDEWKTGEPDVWNIKKRVYREYDCRRYRSSRAARPGQWTG